GRNREIDCAGLSGSEQGYLVSRIYDKLKSLIVIVVPSQKYAEKFAEDLDFFSNGKFPVLFFPSYNILPFTDVAYNNQIAALRISTLYSMINYNIPPIIITTPGALLQKIIPKNELDDFAELVMEGEECDRDLLINNLIAGGYTRSVIVEEPGDFCVRGGILDVFSPGYDDPVRIEWFGDIVDSLRFFSAASQRKLNSTTEAVLLPAGEVVIKKEALAAVVRRIKEQAARFNIPAAVSRGIIDKIKNEGLFQGIESMLPMIYPEPDTFFDYLPGTALFVLSDQDELKKSAAAFWEIASKNYLEAPAEDKFCASPETIYLEWSEARELLRKYNPVNLKILPVSEFSPDNGEDNTAYSQWVFEVEDNASMRAELKKHQDEDNLLLPLAKWIQDNQDAGNAAIIVCSTKSQANRIVSLLGPYGLDPSIIDKLPAIKQMRSFFYICIGSLSSGFIWPFETLAIITDDEIFGPKRRRRKRVKPSIKTKLLEFGDLKTDDLVVHIEHGIGRYKDLVKLKLPGATSDFLLILFKDDDKLYLPVDRMGMIDKYMGVEGINPVLDKMGGKSWGNVKKKIKKSVAKMAAELLKLYAKRSVREGHAFLGADRSFRDFEAGFPFEETDDQLSAIEDVLHDMEQPLPMDRLVCGDVGYGKTEVALRASFKAVSGGKQVAILVPTTVLAEQHFNTFSERFKDYPVEIECLSRFRSKKKQREIIEWLKSGKLDIVIGTHRLVQKDISFKDLGLFVLDEEQRFGVKHKERLKKLRSTVDVLALTATPIPRTLHMSLMGVRDISIISTPPEDRQSIITYVCKFDFRVIADAVKKELKRGGQIFFIHNNIHSIWAMAKKLQELIPEVRIDVAHGRLPENDLEKVMLRFMNKEIDMLVCTTIVESGLDIPSANTLLVNRADRFGLAQMYQLRGRVGRSDEQAYAYLFIPDETILSVSAKKRLKVLMEHSGLGSGFQIAMNDLKLRGGGTILGASQSGHIAAVGYDMFLQLMEKSVAELKGEPFVEDLDPEINVRMSCYIPESYISDIDLRLSIYRRLTKMDDVGDIAEFRDDLKDRFGRLPDEVINLLVKMILRIMSIKAGVKRLDLVDENLVLEFSEAHQSNPFGIIDMIDSGGNRYKFTSGHAFHARLLKNDDQSPVVQSKNILKEIAQRVNG
ncbi:MAG: transcription-repair coupling factor, partial [Deltaproteobacteria bacterium]|nr:transcription-repair coupling factor [Deltaproteobacteria bacterium]